MAETANDFLDDFRSSAGGFDFFFGRGREMVSANRQGFVDFAIAKYSQTIILTFDHALGAEFRFGNNRTSIETTELTEIDDRVKLAGWAERHSAFALTAQLRQSAIKRCLAAFKTGADVVASVLTFLAARRRFTVSGSDTATNALFGFARAFGGFKIC